MEIEPKIQSLGAFTVMGLVIRTKGRGPEIPKLWNQFMQRYKEIAAIVHPEFTYGVIRNFDKNTGEYDYMAGVEVPPDTKPPHGMIKWNIPAQTYAVFPTTLQKVHAIFRYIYDEWLPNSKEFVRGSGPEFELYDDSFSPEDRNSVFYIYIPVVKK
ncbi:MAG: hypothetical protein PWQ79_738 [Thermococcaceae archaeon]|nr:hypothetical protein [Thermococcaceae archaeon]MDK2913823.1 hypothetical protein [Thermococcaceae archaeon]